jgi:hypothetical protein
MGTDNSSDDTRADNANEQHVFGLRNRIRKHQSGVGVDGERGGADKRRRREGRGLGPFSGGQLTIIIVTLAVVIGFPIAAFSVTGSATNIVDPVTAANKAKVDSQGNLYTATHDATSGVAAKVTSGGALTVSGSVTATPTPPNSSYDRFWSAGEGDCISITPAVPAGKALIVTSITATITSGTDERVAVYAVTGTGTSTCTPTIFADEIGVAGLRASGVMNFPSGFPVKAGRVVGVLLFSSAGDHTADVIVKGYLVSSTLCTVNGPPTGCN